MAAPQGKTYRLIFPLVAFRVIEGKRASIVIPNRATLSVAFLSSDPQGFVMAVWDGVEVSVRTLDLQERAVVVRSA